MKNKFIIILNFLKYYRSKSVFARNFIFAFFIIAVYIGFLSIMFYKNGTRTLEKQLIESNNVNLLQCANIVDVTVDEINYVASNISMQEDIRLYATFGNNIAALNNIDLRVLNTVRQNSITRKCIESIYIYSQADDTIIANGGIVSRASFKDSSWYDIYAANNDLYKENVSLRLKNNNYPYVISVIKPIISSGTGAKAGAVIVNISVEQLGDMLESNDDITDNFFILDKNNTVLYSKNKENIGYPADTDEYFILKDMERTDKGIIDRKGKDIYSMFESPKYGSEWSFMLKIPIENYMEEYNSIFYNVNVIVSLAIIFAITVALFMAIESFNSIEKIIEVIEKHGIVSAGSGKNIDEIDYIVSNIVSTIELSKEMRKELIVQFSEMQKAQAEALQAQITPHFLRNTLEIINLKAFELFGGENSVSEMLALLGRMINSFIRSDDYIVTLGQELEYTKNYFDILLLKGKKIHFDYNIEKELYDCKMIKFTMQPIIENAELHAFFNYDGEEIIYARCIRDGENIILTVEDNGCGISDRDMEEINRHINDEKANGALGLRNINRRYKIVYGSEYGLTIGKSAMGGLLVTVKFPDIK